MTKTEWPISQLSPVLQTKAESPRAASLERSIRPFIISYLSLTWENVHSSPIKRLHEKERLSLLPALELGEALQVAPAQRAPLALFFSLWSIQSRPLFDTSDSSLTCKQQGKQWTEREGGGHHGEAPLQKLMSAPYLVKLTTVLQYSTVQLVF